MSTKVLVVLSGMPGTGKSTLASALAIELGLSVFSVDPIEAAIIRAGIDRGFATGLAAYLVADQQATDELARGRSAIVDAVNAVPEAQQLWIDRAAHGGAALRVIECTCSVEAEHRARVEARPHRFGFEPAWGDVVARRAEWTPWSVPTLTVDSVESVTSNVARVIAWIDA
jgi:predicted kinase